MNILVTGGAGFIGSALCRHLVAKAEHRVVNLDKLTYAGNLASLTSVADAPGYRFVQADIGDQEKILDLLRAERIDIVIHLAAESHVDRSIEGPGAFIETNVVGTFRLLAAVLEYWRGLPLAAKERFRFHHVSTDEVFGDLPFEGGIFTEQSPYAPSSPYAASKAASDHLVRAWHHTYGLPVVISNCSNNFGPYQFPEKLIPLAILNAIQGAPIPIYGAGKNVRDWLYVDDHARALECVALQGVPGESYNIGARSERTNLWVVERLCDILDVKKPRSSGSHRDLLSFVTDRPGHDRRYAIDPEKVERELGWRPSETFDSALEKTIDWYLAAGWWWQPILERRNTLSVGDNRPDDVQAAEPEPRLEQEVSAPELNNVRARILQSRLDAAEAAHAALVSGPITGRAIRLQKFLRRIRGIKEGIPLSGEVFSSEIASLSPAPQDIITDNDAPVEVARRSRMERPKRDSKLPGQKVPWRPLVSVVMTTHNSEAFVKSAVLSILNQTHRRLELIVVDDASTDGTLDELNELRRSDGRIKVIRADQNRGTYWAKNLGIEAANGDLITFMDSDDISVPDRIAKQVSALRKRKTVASTCNYERRNERGEIVLNRGVRERKALVSLMYKRGLNAEIGHFDSVRTSADAEFYDRIRLVYGRKAVKNVAAPLYIANLRPGSLTMEADNANDLSKNRLEQFLSRDRHQYASCYQEWHRQVLAAGNTPYVPFPVTNRPFPAPGKLQIAGNRFDSQPVIGFMASFPAREKELAATVQTLLPQVDRLYIYLNGYEKVPAFLADDRITAIAAANLIDLRDTGKFSSMPDAPPGYYFTVDDDLIYPSDYCSRLVRKIEQYDRRGVVGVHGVILEQPFVRYFSEGRQVYSFKRALLNDSQVNVLGTGTVAFHSSTLSLDLKDFPKPGMADVWFAIAAKKAKVPLIAIERPNKWIQEIEAVGPSLFDEFKDNDRDHSVALASMGDWSF